MSAQLSLSKLKWNLKYEFGCFLSTHFLPRTCRNLVGHMASRSWPHLTMSSAVTNYQIWQADSRTASYLSSKIGYAQQFCYQVSATGYRNKTRHLFPSAKKYLYQAQASCIYASTFHLGPYLDTYFLIKPE
jgi:hypothetical protein